MATLSNKQRETDAVTTATVVSALSPKEYEVLIATYPVWAAIH